MKRFIVLTVILIIAVLTVSASLACKNKHLDLPEKYPAEMAISDVIVTAHSYEESDQKFDNYWSIKNPHRLKQFIANVNNKRKDAIRIVTYNQSDDVIVAVLDFDGKVIHCYKDFTRSEKLKNKGIQRSQGKKIIKKDRRKQLPFPFLNDLLTTQYVLVDGANNKKVEVIATSNDVDIHHPVEKKVGTETKTLENDINGDGKLDIVSMHIVHRTVDSGPISSNVENLEINKNAIEIKYFADLISPGDITIVDIDKKDKYKEVALSYSSDGGEDWETYFYHFDGSKVVNFGTITGNINGIKIDGSGKLSTFEQGAIGFNWIYENNYRLTSDRKLARIPRQFYSLISNDEATVLLRLPLQRSKTDRSTVATLKPGETVKFLTSDNKSGFLIQNSKGKKGWLNTKNYDHVPGIDKSLQEIFNGLNLAD